MRSLVWVIASAFMIGAFAMGCSGGTTGSGQITQKSGNKPVGTGGSAKLPDPGPPPPIIKQ